MLMSNLTSLTAAQFKRAAEIREKIDALQAELDGLWGSAAGAGGKGKFSASGLARLRAAQKARWARVKAAQSAGPGKPKKARRNMSAEGRARIIAGQKARWAKVRAAQAGK